MSCRGWGKGIITWLNIGNINRFKVYWLCRHTFMIRFKQGCITPKWHVGRYGLLDKKLSFLQDTCQSLSQRSWFILYRVTWILFWPCLWNSGWKYVKSLFWNLQCYRVDAIEFHMNVRQAHLYPCICKQFLVTDVFSASCFIVTPRRKRGHYRINFQISQVLFYKQLTYSEVKIEIFLLISTV